MKDIILYQSSFTQIFGKLVYFYYLERVDNPIFCVVQEAPDWVLTMELLKIFKEDLKIKIIEQLLQFEKIFVEQKLTLNNNLVLEDILIYRRKEGFEFKLLFSGFDNYKPDNRKATSSTKEFLSSLLEVHPH